MNAVAQLEREWPILIQRQLASAMAQWRTSDPLLRRFDSPARLLRFLHSNAPADTDGPLLALLRLAANDPLAGRFVLHALLPGLKAQARRISRRPGQHEELWELLLFYAWQAICFYPADSRRSRVAANVLLQVLHDTTRELRRMRQPAETKHEPSSRPRPRVRAATAPRRHGLARAVTVADAVEAGVVSRRDASLILRSRGDGVALAAIAREWEVSYAALLKRRQRAERRFRAWAALPRDVRNRGVRVLTSCGRPHASPADCRSTHYRRREQQADSRPTAMRPQG